MVQPLAPERYSMTAVWSLQKERVPVVFSVTAFARLV